MHRKSVLFKGAFSGMEAGSQRARTHVTIMTMEHTVPSGAEGAEPRRGTQRLLGVSSALFLDLVVCFLKIYSTFLCPVCTFLFECLISQ